MVIKVCFPQSELSKLIRYQYVLLVIDPEKYIVKFLRSFWILHKRERACLNRNLRGFECTLVIVPQMAALLAWSQEVCTQAVSEIDKKKAPLRKYGPESNIPPLGVYFIHPSFNLIFTTPR